MIETLILSPEWGYDYEMVKEYNKINEIIEVLNGKEEKLEALNKLEQMIEENKDKTFYEKSAIELDKEWIKENRMREIIEKYDKVTG